MLELVLWLLLSHARAEDLPAPQKLCADQLISIFENSTTSIKYDYIEALGDGRGYTAGRSGFVSRDGDMLDVVKRYAELHPGAPLTRMIPNLQKAKGSASVVGLKQLPVLWRAAVKDPLFIKAQDEVNDRTYYKPAMDQARSLGLNYAFSKVALYEAMIQHGPGDDSDSLGGLVRRASQKAGGPPLKVGEDIWLKAFLQVRKDTLLQAADPSTRDEWRKSVGRAEAMFDIFNSRNFAFAGGVTVQVFGDSFRLRCGPAVTAAVDPSINR